MTFTTEKMKQGVTLQNQEGEPTTQLLLILLERLFMYVSHRFWQQNWQFLRARVSKFVQQGFVKPS